jgi:hypothetical protein
VSYARGVVRDEHSKPQTFVAPAEPIKFDKPAPSSIGAILVAALLIAIVVIGLVLMMRSGTLG